MIGQHGFDHFPDQDISRLDGFLGASQQVTHQVPDGADSSDKLFLAALNRLAFLADARNPAFFLGQGKLIRLGHRWWRIHRDGAIIRRKRIHVTFFRLIDHIPQTQGQQGIELLLVVNFEAVERKRMIQPFQFKTHVYARPQTANGNAQWFRGVGHFFHDLTIELPRIVAIYREVCAHKRRNSYRLR
ncbi:MAG: hypothetical protein Q8O38_09500 [Sulfurimicrobium sp.]|nr:hypothetical protein [Sulfurimicrobium sp.]